MALSHNQQILELFRKSNDVLICFRKDFTLDGLVSAMSLATLLKKLEKSVDIVCDGFTMRKNLNWLKNHITIEPRINDLQKLIISLDIKSTGVEKLSYNTEDGELKISITPKQGSFRQDQLKTEPSKYRYDLIIVLDAPDLESLGDIYLLNTDFFHDTPIINIDNQGENENFGQVNLVNLSAVAVGEVIYDFLERIDRSFLDEKIATYLLAGMISKTKSFKTNNVTPKSLQTASKLMDAGAKKDLIINNLYRNQSIQTLNLWGKIMHRLKNNPDGKIVWSLVSEDDFTSSSTTKDDLHGIIEELIASLPEAEIIVLLYRYGQNVEGLIHSDGKHDVMLLAKPYRPEGSRQLASFTPPHDTLVEAENEVIRKIAENVQKF